jgi:ribosomal protein S18 acetylase RimI-like enzyme
VRYGEASGARAGYWGSSLRVRIGWRGMGVGEALGRRGRADAKAAGARVISLVVYADNMPAVNLYRKHGYKRRLVPELDEQFQRAAATPEHYCIIMTKEL